MSWLGTVLSYATGGLTGAFNSYMQNDAINSQISAQASENQKNRDFALEMYNRQWEDYLKNYPELMKMSNDAQFNLWKNQFDTQAKYNSPAEQVSRSLVAGLNPTKEGLVQGSNMSMQPSSVQPPAHIQGSPLGGSISPVGIPDMLPNNLLSQAAQFAKDISQVDINKKQLDKMEAEIDKMLSEKDLIDSQRSFQEMKNGVYQVLGYTKETKEVISLVKQAYMYEAQGDNYKAAEEMHRAQAELFRSEKALNDERLPFVGKLMQSEIDRNKSEDRRNRAQAFEASERGKIQVSVGAYYQSMADTENALRDGRATAQELSNDISTISKYIAANELKYSDNTLEARCKMVAEGLKQQELITQPIS